MAGQIPSGTINRWIGECHAEKQREVKALKRLESGKITHHEKSSDGERDVTIELITERRQRIALWDSIIAGYEELRVGKN